jgi:ribonuclease HI
MKTSTDWLLVGPQAPTWPEGAQKARELVAADPVAAAIEEEEAARFYAIADMVRFAARDHQVRWIRQFGLRLDGPSEPNVRRALRMLLRQWRQETKREAMVRWGQRVCYDNYENAGAGPDYWTAERFTQALADREIDIVWVCNVARDLGVLTDATAFLEAHGAAERVDEYRYWCDVGRLTLRKLVYPEPENAQVQQETAAAAAPVSAESLSSLAEKERTTSALRQSVRRLERDRKRLKEQNRRLTKKQMAEVSQARSEVAAAERELRELQAAHAAALAGRESQFEQEKAAIEKQIAEARAAYARTLRELRVAPVMAGRSVQVVGATGDPLALQAQVESLGGRIAQPGEKATAIVDGGGGHAALERQLRSLALGDIHIKCDGNWRRKMGRHGISNAAFEVLREGRSIYQEGRPVCCGPLTSPIMSEYAAIIMALSWVLRVRPAAGSRVLVWSDCKFLVDHVNGRWRLAPERGCAMLDHLLGRLLRRAERLGYRVMITWVPRANVHDVDRLCAATYYATAWYHRVKKGVKAPTLPLEQFLRTV